MKMQGQTLQTGTKKSLDFLISSHLGQAFLASLFITLAAQIQIPLYFTPVPLTLQTLAVVLTSLFLGKRAPLAILLYLLQGALGAPVWAGGNASGFLRLFGPTGGYLLSYIPLSFFLGHMIEKTPMLQFRPTALFSLLFSSFAVHLILGSLWLAQFVGIERCLLLGCFPFLLGDSLKALIITQIAKKGLFPKSHGHF